MKINPFIFRNYDIRGVVDKDLDEKKVEALGKAFGTFLNRRKIYEIVAGRDSRLTGKAYQTAFAKGVLSTGLDVIDLGEIMTQMMYFGQYRFQTNGGVMLTASHNPWNYNGFKLGIGFSETTGREEVQELKKTVETEKFYQSKKPGKLTKANKKEFVEDYYRDVLKRVRINKKFKVVLTKKGGFCGTMLPLLFLPKRFWRDSLAQKLSTTPFAPRQSKKWLKKMAAFQSCGLLAMLLLKKKLPKKMLFLAVSFPATFSLLTMLMAMMTAVMRL